MPLVVRKIEYTKWEQRKILDGESASADAITGSLRTQKNTLSLWSISNSTELEEAVLAIVSNFEKPDSIDVLVIESADLEKCGLEVKKSPGMTKYKEFSDRHRDIINLEYNSLGVVAGVVIESIGRLYNERIRSAEIKKILHKGLEEGKIDRADLHPKLQEKLFPSPPQ